MSAPLDRAWFNALIDDSGDGVSGTVWNKAQVDGLLDTIDASLANVVAKSGAPVAGVIATFSDADTIGSGGLRLVGNVISPPTLDGADNSAVIVGGGGSSAQARGAYAVLSGNEHANAGSVQLVPGNHANARTELYRSNGMVAASVRGSDGVALFHFPVGLLSGQLGFPATQIPATDPQTLDDYREGLWTPVLSAQSGASGQVYSMQAGQFTKIGRLVLADFWITLTNKGTMAGGIEITGLPAIVGGVTYSAGGAGYFNALAAPVANIYWAAVPGTAKLQGFVVPASGSTSSFGTLDAATYIANNTEFRARVIYHST